MDIRQVYVNGQWWWVRFDRNNSVAGMGLDLETVQALDIAVLRAPPGRKR
jgi:hypothetical protein